jgi:hypothetical protein
MSCKSWWRRGDDNLTGTSGRDWLFGGGGNNTVEGLGGDDFIFTWRGNDDVDGGAGNDFLRTGRGDDNVGGGDGNDRIRSGRGHDEVDGGAGSDRVFAGSGDDYGIYTLSENVGSKDYYHGGRGTDTLVLRVYSHELTPEVQADLDAFAEFLTQQGSGWKYQSFQFEAFDLKVKGWENLEVEIIDASTSVPPPDTPPPDLPPPNAAPVAGDDAVFVNVPSDPILEVEPNNPSGIPLSAGTLLDGTPQVIERSSFHISPSADVGDDTLPRVLIQGNIAVSMFGGANDVDLYAITLMAGEKLILDIDYGFGPSSLDAQLFLMDDSGTVLAENDNESADMGGAGSEHPFDPYLEYIDPGSGGTYYVAVSAFNNDPDGTGFFNDGGFMGGDYDLNVSIENAAADLGTFAFTADQLLANDSDADGDALTITGVGNSVNGSVELTGTGEILFRPGPTGPGAFDYTVSDGNGGEATATVTVNGNAVSGTSASETLFSTAENDLLTGNGGNDTFSFAPGSGHDTIADFVLGSDNLETTGGMSIDQVEERGNGTLVTFDTGDSVLLADVSGVIDIDQLQLLG